MEEYQEDWPVAPLEEGKTVFLHEDYLYKAYNMIGHHGTKLYYLGYWYFYRHNQDKTSKIVRQPVASYTALNDLWILGEELHGLLTLFGDRSRANTELGILTDAIRALGKYEEPTVSQLRQIGQNTSSTKMAVERCRRGPKDEALDLINEIRHQVEVVRARILGSS